MKLQSHSQIANTCYEMCLLFSGSEAAAGQGAADLLHQPHPHPEAEGVQAKDINPPQQHGMPLALPCHAKNLVNYFFSLCSKSVGDELSQSICTSFRVYTLCCIVTSQVHVSESALDRVAIRSLLKPGTRRDGTADTKIRDVNISCSFCLLPENIASEAPLLAMLEVRIE